MISEQKLRKIIKGLLVEASGSRYWSGDSQEIYPAADDDGLPVDTSSYDEVEDMLNDEAVESALRSLARAAADQVSARIEDHESHARSAYDVFRDAVRRWFGS